MGLRTRFRSFSRPVQLVLGVFLAVFLVVGLTIGTAVVGSMVLGVGDSTGERMSNPPQAQFDFEQAGSETVDVTHAGGQEVWASDLLVVVDGEPQTWEKAGDSYVGTGDTTTVSASSGATVEVVWDIGDARAVLGSFTVQ
jgi:hypothetical protein